MSGIYLAIDPGTDKCGLALVDGAGRALERAIVARAEFPRIVDAWRRAHPDIRRALLGNGTGHKEVRAQLPEDASFPIEIVPERNTTLRARARYFRENPPPWFLRWFPVSLRVPPVPVDDWAAVLIAEDYLAARREGVD